MDFLNIANQVLTITSSPVNPHSEYVSNVFQVGGVNGKVAREICMARLQLCFYRKVGGDMHKMTLPLMCIVLLMDHRVYPNASA